MDLKAGEFTNTSDGGSPLDPPSSLNMKRGLKYEWSRPLLPSDSRIPNQGIARTLFATNRKFLTDSSANHRVNAGNQVASQVHSSQKCRSEALLYRLATGGGNFASDRRIAI
jgi:hypothetical protein